LHPFIKTFLKKTVNLQLDSSLVLSGLEDYLRACHFQPFCKITTTRRKYKHGNFSIDLDYTDFGYHIGEIELLIQETGHHEEKDLSAVAAKDVADFCRQYELNTTSPIRGKVLEYAFRFRPDLYQKWLQCGLLKNKGAI